PGDLARNALLQKTFGAGPLIFNSIRDAIPRVPEYSAQLVSLIGPTELGTGFLWATLVGFAWLLAQSVLALATTRPRLSPWVLGWICAVLVWTLAMVTPSRDLASLHVSDPWVAVAAAAVLVAVGTAEQYLHNARRNGWGLALLGLVVVAVLAERLVIAVTPKVANATLSFRLLMPIVPLFALVAGGGIWAGAGSEDLVDLNSQPRNEEQKRQYILDRVGPHGVNYVVDFNVNWTDPASDAARQWRQTYETLASRPNLETAYLMRDKFDNPVFYV